MRPNLFGFAQHSKVCLGNSLASAVQNFRDDESISRDDFLTCVKDGVLLDVAESYLADGTQTCTCHVEAFRHVQRIWTNEGPEAAKSLNQSYCSLGNFTFEQFSAVSDWIDHMASWVEPYHNITFGD